MNHAIFNNEPHVLYCELLCRIILVLLYFKIFMYKIDNYKVVRIHKADHHVFSFVLSKNVMEASNEYIFD